MPGFEDPWSALGVSREADESEIKRAYARLLKTIRPDEDAEAFQKLVETRNAALAYARRSNGQRQQPKGPALEEPQVVRDSVEAVEPDVQIAEPPKARIVWEEPAPETPLASQAVKGRQPDVTDLLNAILAGLKLNAQPSERAGANDAIGDLAALPAGVRKLAEPKLLQALAPLAPILSDRLMRGRSRSIIQRLFRQTREDPEQTQRAVEQFDLVRRLNEEFSWTEADRRVHALVGRDAATSIMLYLNAFQRWFDAKKADDDTGRLRALPSIDERDARAYFGDLYGKYAPLLTKVRSGSRWPVRWSTRMFVVLPGWLVGSRHYLTFFIWVIAFYTALFTIAQRHAIAYGGASYAALVAIIGCLPLLALHVWAGAYAYRLDIRRFVAITRAANRRGIFDPDERSSFIAKSSTYARRSRQQRKRRFPWWLILLGVVSLMRIIIALSRHSS